MKIGIIDWHADLTNIMKQIIPDSHTVKVYDQKTTQIDDPLDILINNALNAQNDKFPFNFFAVPYASISDYHINEWNTNPKCLGILDVSNTLKDRFPALKKPVWGYLPSVPGLPVYKESGSKVICLANAYKERFPTEYAIATTITSNIYGHPDNPVNDVETLKDAKWLLHMKRDGFVCNAVVKALACGVPVILDTESYVNTFLEKLIEDKVNGIVLPADQIKGYLDTLDDATYAKIKENCVARADSFRHPVKWTDGWWEPKAGGKRRVKRGGFIPSVMSGVGRLAPILASAGVAQASRLLSRKKRLGAHSRRRRSRAVKRRTSKK